MAELKDMVEAAKTGKCNYLFFHFSSHGTQVPDQNKDESDHADEAFAPTDIQQEGNVWHPDHIISDDEFRDLFSQLPTESVMLEVFLDTCHSGTGIKGIDLLLDRKPRWIPPPSLDAFKKVNGKKVHGLREGLLEEDMKNHVFFAACSPEQTSADALIGDSWNGAFTYYMCQVIKESNNGSSRTKNLEKLINYLKDKYTQIPQLECSKHFKKKPIGYSL